MWRIRYARYGVRRMATTFAAGAGRDAYPAQMLIASLPIVPAKVTAQDNDAC